MASNIPFKNHPPVALLHPDELGAWIGQRLMQRRLALNLTREELAKRGGVSPEAVKLVETRGRSSLNTLTRLIGPLGLQDRLETLFIVDPPRSFDELMARETRRPRKRARKGKSGVKMLGLSS